MKSVATTQSMLLVQKDNYNDGCDCSNKATETSSRPNLVQTTPDPHYLRFSTGQLES